jgi:hypothetical protein
MELRVLQRNHLVLEFQYTTNCTIEHMSQNTTLLGVNYLIVTLLQASEYLYILNVHGR